MVQFILTSTVCLSIFYAAYLLVFRNEVNFKQLRFYLLLSVLLAVVIPLHTFRINLDLYENIGTVEKSANTEPINSSTATISSPSNNPTSELKGNPITRQENSTWLGYCKLLYGIVSVTLLIRLLIQVSILIVQYFKSDRIKQGNYIIIRNSKFKNTFSFFNWIFLHSDNSSGNDLEQVISHEKIHVSQYHSLDLIVLELLAAVMWFNPLVWMMRSTIQLVHEYLADEGVLSTGIDRLKYQALLINQVTEERLICLSSSFNHSLIKKRMIMMTKSKFNQRTKLRILTLVPVAIILFLGVACINGQNKGNAVTAIEPVRMNVFYVGVDNPIKIAASGYDASELSVSVDNGTITGKNGEYLVRPAKQGTANVVVSNSSGKEIQKTSFRVKNFPDPIAAVKTAEGLKTNGNITKKELLDAKGIIVALNNMDFDVNFTVKSFVLSYTLPGKFVIVEDVSKSDKFSEKQIEGIKSLIQWQKVTIEAITVSGPDSIKRKLNPIVFLISGE